jgi:phage FluMu gp28-like protein
LKVEIFSKPRMAFEKRSVRVPISRLVREDLESVNRVTTASGGVTYRSPHSADGHADRCTALALACGPVTGSPLAAQLLPGRVNISSPGRQWIYSNEKLFMHKNKNDYCQRQEFCI